MVVIEFHRFLNLLSLRHLSSDVLFGIEFEIEVEEVDWCLLLSELLGALLGFGFHVIEDLEVVFSVTLDTYAIFFSLIESLIW